MAVWPPPRLLRLLTSRPASCYETNEQPLFFFFFDDDLLCYYNSSTTAHNPFIEVMHDTSLLAPLRLKKKKRRPPRLYYRCRQAAALRHGTKKVQSSRFGFPFFVNTTLLLQLHNPFIEVLHDTHP